MSVPISIRQATVSDKCRLLDIEDVSFRTDKISRRQMHYLLTQAKAATWIIVAGEVSVGYGICLLPCLPRPARLYSLAVLPQWRSQGMARRLCEHMLAELKSLHYSHCRLEVRSSQVAVQEFYHSLGFRAIVELPDYYQDKAKGLRMECVLND